MYTQRVTHIIYHMVYALINHTRQCVPVAAQRWRFRTALLLYECVPRSIRASCVTGLSTLVTRSNHLFVTLQIPAMRGLASCKLLIVTNLTVTLTKHSYPFWPHVRVGDLILVSCMFLFVRPATLQSVLLPTTIVLSDALLGHLCHQCVTLYQEYASVKTAMPFEKSQCSQQRYDGCLAFASHRVCRLLPPRCATAIACQCSTPNDTQDFSGVIAKKTNFQGSDLRGARFFKADLDEVLKQYASNSDDVAVHTPLHPP
jgi:Pentapeptide repeats (8 copies)